VRLIHIALLILWGAPPAVGFPQTPPTRAPGHPPRFNTDATAIMVDVVVRDRANRPVTDLTPEDFEVREQGTPQVIGDVTRMWTPGSVSGSASNGTSGKSVTGGSTVMTPSAEMASLTSITALVFERLSPESRLPAMNAALQYAAIGDAQTADYQGVFIQDLSLRVVQPFTTNRQRLEAGIRLAATSATSFNESNRVGLGTGALPSTIGAEFGGGLVSPSMAPDPMADLAAKAQSSRGVEVKQQTSATLDGLRSLVTALSEVRGRKTIVYFSDGLALYAPGFRFSASEFRAQLDAVIALANRANVSVYPIDTVGLRVHSQDLANATALRDAANRDLEANAASPGGGGGAIDLGEGIVQGGTTSAVFHRLASGTGGLVIENTNDLAKGLRRIADDRHFYYLVTYVPRDQDFHGETRTLQVRVRRHGVKVFSRNSYLALRQVVAPATPKVEARAWAALQMRPLPRSLPFDGVALNLMNRQGHERVLVALGTQSNALGDDTDASRTSPATAEIVFAAQLRDATGVVVRKASEVRTVLTGQATPVEFVREPTLQPGTYMLECAINDLGADRIAAKYLPVTVPESQSMGLTLGDLLLVERMVPTPTGTDEGAVSVLATEGGLIIPRVDRTFVAGSETAVAFFTRAKSVDMQQPVVARADLLHGHTMIGQGALAPTATPTPGVIEVSGTIPLVSLAPGPYVLRVTLAQGSTTVSKEVEIRVVEQRARPQ
jgi:VWFA-related protein